MIRRLVAARTFAQAWMPIVHWLLRRNLFRCVNLSHTGLRGFIILSKSRWHIKESCSLFDVWLYVQVNLTLAGFATAKFSHSAYVAVATAMGLSFSTIGLPLLLPASVVAVYVNEFTSSACA